MTPITIPSLMDIRFVSAPEISPDGARTAFVCAKPNYRENSYESWLHLMDNATGEARQLTFAGKESSFAWEDSSTLLFPAERSEADKPEKLAEKIQISTTHMSHIETADTKLSLQVLADLSTALGVSADALIFGTESSDTKTALLQSISDRFSRLSERQARFVTDNVIYQIDILSREDLS